MTINQGYGQMRGAKAGPEEVLCNRRFSSVPSGPRAAGKAVTGSEGKYCSTRAAIITSAPSYRARKPKFGEAGEGCDIDFN